MSRYDLENVSLHRGVLDSSCCPGDGRHPMVGLKVNLRRKSLYYDYIVIAPTIMLCVMTLASFLLPCDRGEKMNIGNVHFDFRDVIRVLFTCIVFEGSQYSLNGSALESQYSLDFSALGSETR